MALFFTDTTGDEKLIFCENENAYAPRYKENNCEILAEETFSIQQPTTTAINDAVSNDDEYFGLPPPNVDIKKYIKPALRIIKPCATESALELQEITESIDDAMKNRNKNRKSYLKRGQLADLDHSDINVLTGKMTAELQMCTNVESELKSTNKGPNFERIKAMPKLSAIQKKKLNRHIRSKTKGADWYNLPATEVTDEVRNELKIIQMRSVLDPKHFYKKNDLKVLPKYFQVGTVQHSALDNERNVKKTKVSLVNELLNDEAFQKFNKRKYKEIQKRKEKYAHRKTVQKMKKLKKRK